MVKHLLPLVYTLVLGRTWPSCKNHTYYLSQLLVHFSFYTIFLIPRIPGPIALQVECKQLAQHIFALTPFRLIIFNFFIFNFFDGFFAYCLFCYAFPIRLLRSLEHRHVGFASYCPFYKT